MDWYLLPANDFCTYRTTSATKIVALNSGPNSKLIDACIILKWTSRKNERRKWCAILQHQKVSSWMLVKICKELISTESHLCMRKIFLWLAPNPFMIFKFLPSFHVAFDEIYIWHLIVKLNMTSRWYRSKQLNLLQHLSDSKINPRPNHQPNQSENWIVNSYLRFVSISNTFLNSESHNFAVV